MRVFDYMGRPIGSKNRINHSIEVNCLHCKKIFKVFPYMIKCGEGKFCSQKCFMQFVKKGYYPNRGFKKGIKYSDKGDFEKGHIPWNKNKELPQISGKNHPLWKGGIFIFNNRCRIYSPKHPYRNRHNYVFRYRLVAEKLLGRYLVPIKEVIHHINGNSLDDRPENLYLFSKKEHDKYESSKIKPILTSNLPHHTKC